MSNFLKFVLTAVPVLSIGILYSVWDYDSPVRFSAKGRVVEIEWESRNHLEPRIEIRLESGKLKRFSSSRIILDTSSIEVGDSFEKVNDSKICLINSEEFACVN